MAVAGVVAEGRKGAGAGLGRSERPQGQVGRWQRDGLGARISGWTGSAGRRRGRGRPSNPGPRGAAGGAVRGRRGPRGEPVTAGTTPHPTPSRVCYVPGRGKLETFTPRDVPRPLAAKLAVLRLFTCCLRRRRVRQVSQGRRGGRARWGGPGGAPCSALRLWLGLSAGGGPALAPPSGPQPLLAALPCVRAGVAAALQRRDGAGERRGALVLGGPRGGPPSLTRLLTTTPRRSAAGATGLTWC